jgi:hypothetical protein
MNSQRIQKTGYRKFAKATAAHLTRKSDANATDRADCHRKATDGLPAQRLSGTMR